MGLPHVLPIDEVGFSLTMEGSFGWRAEAPFFFWEEAMGRLTSREALASHQLDIRGLALLVTQRRILLAKQSSGIKQQDVATTPLGL